MNMTVLTPPSEEPLALGAAKDYLRIGHDGEDALVRSLIEGARARLEIELGIALVTRTLQITLDAWPASLSRNGIRLAPAPVKALVRVEHVHVSGEREDITARFLLRGDNCVCGHGHSPIRLRLVDVSKLLSKRALATRMLCRTTLF